MDPVPLDFSSLLTDEVQYELGIRAVRTTALCSLAEKVKILRDNWHHRVLSERIELYDPREELDVLTSKVSELEALASEFNYQVDPSVRLPTLYVHCLFRCRRAMFRAVGDTAVKFLVLAKRINSIRARLKVEYPTVDFPSLYVPGEDLAEIEQSMKSLRVKSVVTKPGPETKQEKHEHEKRQEEYEKSDEEPRRHRYKKQKKKKKSKKKRRHVFSSDSESSNSSSSASSSSSSSPDGRCRSNPVARWSYRYAGGSNLHAFLCNVEEAAEAHGVSSAQLLKGVGALLTGDAKTWFRGRKKKLTSWSRCKRDMKMAFLPCEDEDEIMSKIDTLRQSSSETFVVFEARMDELIQQLPKPLKDKVKLAKLMKGLHLFYREKIRSADVESLGCLRRECNSLEKDKTQIQRLQTEERRKEEKKRGYSEEKKRDRFTEERRDRGVSKTYAIHAVGSGDSDSNNEAAGCSEVTVESIVCYKCNKTGHFGSHCPQKLACRVCGNPNVSTEKCPRCFGASGAGLWSAGTVNMTGTWGRGIPGVPTVLPPPNFSQPPPRFTSTPLVPHSRGGNQITPPGSPLSRPHQPRTERN